MTSPREPRQKTRKKQWHFEHFKAGTGFENNTDVAAHKKLAAATTYAEYKKAEHEVRDGLEKKDLFFNLYEDSDDGGERAPAAATSADAETAAAAAAAAPAPRRASVAAGHARVKAAVASADDESSEEEEEESEEEDEDEDSDFE